MQLELDSFGALQQCSTEQELERALAAILSRLGIQRWVYAVDLPVNDELRQQYSIGAYPEPWVERYLEAGYMRIDPIVAHCQSRTTPLLWSDAAGRLRGARNRVASSAGRMFAEAGEFGMGDGFSVPLHGPGTSWGLMSFACEGRFRDELAQQLPLLHMLAFFSHEAARKFATRGSSDGVVHPPLTRRELECLYWAAEGKTSWEIGQVLSISERTAIFHLQNCSRKLGVCSRQAAVARAISLGLIHGR